MLKIANANRYPNINLGVAAGFNSFNSGNWLVAPSSIFSSAIGSFVQPIFNRRKLKTDYNIAKINLEQSSLKINKELLNTTIEVSNKTNTYASLNLIIENNKEQVELLQDALKNANLLYKEGITDYLQVLIVQQQKLAVEINLLDVRKAMIEAYINIYTSMGYTL